ncbi:toxin [Bacillus timonensis]|nr:toxin [Bacillus timonensis]
MKKLVILLSIIFLLGTATHKVGEASPFGTLLRDFDSLAFYVATKHIPNKKLLDTIVVLPEDESHFNQKEATNIISRLSNIHPKILKMLVDEGVKIKLFNGKLTDEPTASHLKGEKPRGYSEDGPTWDDVPGIGGSKLVLVKIGHSEKGKGHGSLNLELHELGHSVDNQIFHKITENFDYKEIWKNEAGKLFPNKPYFLNYPEEYFAETFAMFYYSYESRLQLKTLAPKTYRLFLELEREAVN